MEVNHGLDLEVRLENLVMTGACLSSNEERVVLYDSRRDSRDCAGLVMMLHASDVIFNCSTPCKFNIIRCQSAVGLNISICIIVLLTNVDDVDLYRHVFKLVTVNAIVMINNSLSMF